MTGEPGIGKTSLVRSFLRGLAEHGSDDGLWIATGKCVELHGVGEAYMPVLNALDRLARDSDPLEWAENRSRRCRGARNAE